MKERKWRIINIKYWTTDEGEDYKKVVDFISGLKNQYISDIKVYVDGSRLKGLKKWWQFWKKSLT